MCGIIISEKCMVTPSFLFGLQIALVKICFSCVVINYAIIPLF